MRALTAQELQVFNLPVYKIVHRVSIKDAGGTFQDYSTLEGFNWQVGVDWDDDVDQPVASCTVRLRREHYGLSLSPLKIDSKLNGYVDAGREIKIETACVPDGVAPSAGAWLLAFHGYVDEYDTAKPVLELSCTDLGSRVQLTMIEAVRNYSGSGGTAVETVMQSILDDNGLSSITLYTPNSPGWNIKGLQQRKENVLDALNNLAAQIGWVVKYKYDSGTATYRLTFFQPDRSQTVPRNLTLPGSTGNWASTPDSAALDITGDLDLRVLAAAADWTPSGPQCFMGKYYSGGNQRSYNFELDTTGKLSLWVSLNGSLGINALSTVATGLVDGTSKWLRTTWRASDGRVQFFMSDDGTSWTQLGADVPTAATGALFSGTALGAVGAKPQDDTTHFGGKIFVAQFYAGIGGVLKAQFSASDGAPGDVNVTSSATGEVWTVAGSSAIITGIPDIKPSRYIDVSTLKISRRDIRTAVQVGFYNQAVLDSSGNPTLQFVNVSDATAIAKWGRLWMGLTFGATDNIDALNEATKMANSALLDLKDPKAEQEIEMLLFPNIEPGDVLRFKANGVHYNVDQDLAVVKVSHSIDNSKSRTTVSVRGRPSGSRAQWFDMEAKPGNAPVIRDTGPQAPVGPAGAGTPTATPIPGGAIIKFAPPPVGTWDMFELHLSTASGFTPSSATYKGQSTTDTFERTDLLPGATYYGRIVPKDAAGNAGTSSNQFTFIAGYVTPLVIQPQVSMFSLVPNPDFEANNLAGLPPDTWRTGNAGGAGGVSNGTTTVWGTDAMLETTKVFSGTSSIKLMGGTISGLRRAIISSQLFSVRGTEPYRMSAMALAGTGTTGGLMAVEYYDASMASLGWINVFLTGLSTTVWTRKTVTLSLNDVNARWARVVLIGDPDSGDDLYVDSVQVDSAQHPQIAAMYYRSTALGAAIAHATWTIFDFNQSEVDTHGAVTTGAAWKFTVPSGGAGTYHCAASVGWTGMNTAGMQPGELIIEWMLNGGTYMKRGTRVTLGNSNNQGVHCACDFNLVAGDYVQVRVYQANALAAAKNCEAIREANWVSVARIAPAITVIG